MARKMPEPKGKPKKTMPVMPGPMPKGMPPKGMGFTKMPMKGKR